MTAVVRVLSVTTLGPNVRFSAEVHQLVHGTCNSQPIEQSSAIPVRQRVSANNLDVAVHRELESVVATSLERHLTAAQDWFPHEYVPWDEAADFRARPWEHSQSRLPEVARTALVLNLLTEDNLPSYHFEIAVTRGREDAWAEWLHRWTAEENRHSVAIRDYLVVTRGVDPAALERARMAHMSEGYRSPDRGNELHLIAYLLFQELATRVSHRNTGKASADPACERLLSRIALDENQVILPTLRNIGVFTISGLSAEGQQAQQILSQNLAKIERAAKRFADRRDMRAAS